MLCVLFLTLFVINSNIWCCNALINASNASSNEFPFVVSLRNNTGLHYCGGALITKKHIVTAAHCLYTDESALKGNGNEMLPPENVTVLVGTVSPQTNPGKIYQVKKMTHHPEYNVTLIFRTIEYDIAVIELKEEITLSNVTTIERATANPIEGEKGIVPGWGIDTLEKLANFSTSANLKKLEFNIINSTKCNNDYTSLPNSQNETVLINPLLNTKSMFCAYAGPNSGACVRDSGSPMIVANKLVGFVTFGMPCARNISDIFTSTVYYENFIKQQIES